MILAAAETLEHPPRSVASRYSLREEEEEEKDCGGGEEEEEEEEEILPSRFRAPPASSSHRQGRYRWTEAEWQSLLMDAATGPSGASRRQFGGGSAGWDGQQQHHHQHHQQSITVALLLASIRDALRERRRRRSMALLPDTNGSGEDDGPIAEAIDRILFLGHRPPSDRPSRDAAAIELKDGVALPFAKLTPARCDRWSYYSAILPPGWNVTNRLEASAAAAARGGGGGGGGLAPRRRPLEAKRYFDATLSTFSDEEIRRLCEGVMGDLLPGDDGPRRR